MFIFIFLKITKITSLFYGWYLSSVIVIAGKILKEKKPPSIINKCGRFFVLGHYKDTFKKKKSKIQNTENELLQSYSTLTNKYFDKKD